MLTDWLSLLLGVVLTAGTALFVASEFSLVALDPAHVEPLADDGDRRLAGVRKSLRQLSTQLSGAQVGITLTTILLGYTTQPSLARLLDAPLAGLDWISASAATGICAVVALVVVNVFSMVFGELVPKNMSLSDPLATAKLVSGPQRGFTLALRPVISVLNGSANRLLRLFGVEPKEELSGARSPQELSALVRRSAEVGTLDRGTANLLTKSIALQELTAVDVMTDRTRLVVIQRHDPAASVIELAKETGHSRFPVIEDSWDDIVGVVHLRRAVAVPYEKRAEVPASALMAEVPRVPETVRLGPLLVELRESGPQLAVVVDEYGGTSGVVTLEDVVEELVGDVADEHDQRRAGAYRVADGTWSVPGEMRPDELESQTRMRAPEDHAYETLAGLVMARLGRIPCNGDRVEVDRIWLMVELMSGRRVERLRVGVLDDPEPADANSAGRGR